MGLVYTNAKKRYKKERTCEREEQRKKGSRYRGGKPITSTRAIDELIGEEENRGRKRRKKQTEGLQPSYPRSFGVLLRPEGSYGKPVLLIPKHTSSFLPPSFPHVRTTLTRSSQFFAAHSTHTRTALLSMSFLLCLLSLCYICF